MAPTAAYRDSCTNSSLAEVMLRLLNAALSEGTKNAYKRSITSYAAFSRNNFATVRFFLLQRVS